MTGANVSGRKKLFVSATLYVVSSANPALAQIVPDATLPVNTIVTPSGNTSVISGGTQAGTHLFHSFKSFSVPTGGTASFDNASGIQNIITRVTGGSLSSIDGLIKAKGTANLFLLNPSGIVFGAGASLNIGGSFLASTASSIKFADGTFWSAAPVPATTPLLTMSIPIGLQYGGSAGSIQVQGSTLQVHPGKALALLGGSVSLDSGKLVAPGGRVEVGGVAGTGTIGLNIDGGSNLLSLSFPDGLARADLSLINKAKVDVTSGGGGSIAVNAGNISISGGGILNAGISPNLGAVGVVAGDITVNATGIITLSDSSVIQNLVGSGATGNAGNINIVAGSLYLVKGSQLFTDTFGQGNAGTVNVLAHDLVSLDSAGNNRSTSGIINSVGTGAVGNGGDTNITTGSLSVTNGAQLNAIIYGKGNAGSVNINARDTVSFDGANIGTSGILSSVGTGAVGNGGNINIATGSLSVTNGAQLNAITKGQGNAGNVIINARDTVSFDGANMGASGVLSSVSVDDYGNKAIGNGGDISITTGSLSVTNGAQLNAITKGQGNAGNVIINARDTVSFDGANMGASGILSSVSVDDHGNKAVGNGGDIRITTGSLSVTNGAQLNAIIYGKGNAGNVIINARDTVSFDGANMGASGVLTSVEPGAVGKGGDISLTTGSLSVTRGAELNTLTKGQGNAGNVGINARDTVSFDGANMGISGILSLVDMGAVGKGGDINITARKLSVTNSAKLSVNSEGNGAAGNITVDAHSIYLDNQASISADTNGGKGNIYLRSPLLILRRGSNITTNATGSDNTGGNITIDAQNGVIVAVPKENSDISANSTDFRGGQVTINASGIVGTTFRPQDIPLSDITATGKDSLNGTVQINILRIDPTAGAEKLPATPVNPSRLIAQSCPAKKGNSFIIIGRQGWPPLPSEALRNNNAVALNWVTLDPHQSQIDGHRSRGEFPQHSALRSQIIEATGWVINGRGQVVLTASGLTAKHNGSMPAPATCPTP